MLSDGDAATAAAEPDVLLETEGEELLDAAPDGEAATEALPTTLLDGECDGEGDGEATTDALGLLEVLSDAATAAALPLVLGDDCRSHPRRPQAAG